jgi:hypothetical protein
MHSLRLLLASFALLVPVTAHAACSLLHATDALPPQGSAPSPAQSINETFPATLAGGNAPAIDFIANPQQYADAIKQIAKASISIQSGKIVIDKKLWWTVSFMNYTNNGREHFNGLTRERSPDAGDLAPGSPSTIQVWAVGWYNPVGAFQFGKIWHDPCQPDDSQARLFPEGTMTVKMLFTTADATVVPNLLGSPEVQAAIDAAPAGGPPAQRKAGVVRLLQVDFAVKDKRSTQTGWVFGTFAWIAPSVGDGLWDSLQLVGLQWGNDPGKTADFQEGMVNPGMKGKTFGWEARPFMGFLGRVNGPADNLSSACLSCHSRAQLPRARGGLAVKLPDLTDPAKVATHLTRFFTNVPSGTPQDPGVSADAIALDYSLQVMNAFEHQCAACAAGDLSGTAPRVCKLVRGTGDLAQCAGGVMDAMRNFTARPELRDLIEGPPDRQ